MGSTTLFNPFLFSSTFPIVDEILPCIGEKLTNMFPACGMVYRDNIFFIYCWFFHLTIFLCVAFFVGSSVSVKTGNVFYVLGADGIYVIDPEAKSVVTKITNTTSPGLCTQSNNRRSRLVS